MSHAQANLEGAGGTVSPHRFPIGKEIPPAPCSSCKGLWEQQREWNLAAAEHMSQVLRRLLTVEAHLEQQCHDHEIILRAHAMAIKNLEDGV